MKDEHAKSEKSPTWLTVAEVAAELRLHVATVYRAIDRGELPGVRVGRSVRVKASALQAFLDQFSSKPGRAEMNAEGLLKVAEVAVLLGMSRAKVYNLIYDRKLPCLKVGRSVRVWADVLRAFQESPTRFERPKPVEPAEWLTVDQVAERMGVKPARVRELTYYRIRGLILPSFKVNNRIRVHADALQAFIDAAAPPS